MKWLIGFFVAVVLIIIAPSSNADIITATLPEFSSPYHDTGTYYDPYLVGTFTYDVEGLTILSANISGQWGNSGSGTTAHNELYLDGIALADTHDYSPDPYYNGGPWSYDFAASEFGALADGLADFVAVQTSEYVVRLDETTLEIDAVGIDVEKELLEVIDDDGDGLIEVGEPTIFVMSITVSNPNTDYSIEDVVVTDNLGGDLMLLEVAGVAAPAGPSTKKKKDNGVVLATPAGPVTIEWSGKTEKVHLSWDLDGVTLAPGDSETIEIVVSTDINPGQTPKDDPVYEFTSAEEDHELNSGACAKGMVGEAEVCGCSDPILIDIVEPVD